MGGEKGMSERTTPNNDTKKVEKLNYEKWSHSK
jgi:hypothetical protein